MQSPILIIGEEEVCDTKSPWYSWSESMGYTIPLNSRNCYSWCGDHSSQDHTAVGRTKNQTRTLPFARCMTTCESQTIWGEYSKNKMGIKILQKSPGLFRCPKQMVLFSFPKLTVHPGPSLQSILENTQMETPLPPPLCLLEVNCEISTNAEVELLFSRNS